MDLQLNGKRALVTGSTRGIGFAIGAGLAREGASVILNGRSGETVKAAVKRIESLYPNAQVCGLSADLATPEGAASIAEQLADVDILINNLGIFEPKAFEDIGDGDWLRFFETNVMSGVRLSRHYLPGMRQRDWGRIIFIASESGVNIPPEMIHYGMTKSAQLAIARGLAETTSGTGVTVNSVLPGPTSSEGVATFVEQLARERNLTVEAMEKEFFQSARPSSLLQRFITPEEVSNLVVYVSSPLSAATNGAALRVDGGVVRSMV
jgi:hypothetical protein